MRAVLFLQNTHTHTHTYTQRRRQQQQQQHETLSQLKVYMCVRVYFSTTTIKNDFVAKTKKKRLIRAKKIKIKTTTKTTTIWTKKQTIKYHRSSLIVYCGSTHTHNRIVCIILFIRKLEEHQQTERENEAKKILKCCRRIVCLSYRIIGQCAVFLIVWCDFVCLIVFFLFF